MKRILVIISFVVVLLAVAPPYLHWSEADSNKTLEICIGQTARLGLEVDDDGRCPWFLDSQDNDIVEIGEAETSDKDGLSQVDGADRCVWPVTALEKGRTKLVARQQCAREAPAHDKTVTFEVVVKEAGYTMSLN